MILLPERASSTECSQLLLRVSQTPGSERDALYMLIPVIPMMFFLLQ